jgi:hypothetical protein
MKVNINSKDPFVVRFLRLPKIWESDSFTLSRKSGGVMLRRVPKI